MKHLSSHLDIRAAAEDGGVETFESVWKCGDDFDGGFGGFD